jgi:hypothetical protein
MSAGSPAVLVGRLGARIKLCPPYPQPKFQAQAEGIVIVVFSS